MPFKSEKQRRYLHIHEPQIAKRWEKESMPRKAPNQTLRPNRRKTLKSGSIPTPTRGAPTAAERLLAKRSRRQRVRKSVRSSDDMRGGGALRKKITARFDQNRQLRQKNSDWRSAAGFDRKAFAGYRKAQVGVAKGDPKAATQLARFQPKVKEFRSNRRAMLAKLKRVGKSTASSR